jgi:IstB-like ATP binding protein
MFPSRRRAELLFEVFSRRYERGSTIVTSNLPFEEWTSVFGAERLTGALLDRLTCHVHILSMNGESYRLTQSARRRKLVGAGADDQSANEIVDPLTGRNHPLIDRKNFHRRHEKGPDRATGLLLHEG